METTSDQRSILVVEDDAEIRATLTELLASEGYDVACAANGREGLDHLKKAPALPRLILLDLLMPQSDGFQFRERQLRNPQWAAIPVVVMTGDDHLFDRVATLRAAAYVAKPANLEALLDLISRLLPSGRHP